jgi:hypothetical protein
MTDTDFHKRSYKDDFGVYPTTVNWNDHPLVMQRLGFTRKQKIAVQVAITFVLLLALYSAYGAVGPMLAGTGHTGFKMPEDARVAGWFYVLVPILAIVPGVYTFMFLKYNFNRNGLVLKADADGDGSKKR